MIQVAVTAGFAAERRQARVTAFADVSNVEAARNLNAATSIRCAPSIDGAMSFRGRAASLMRISAPGPTRRQLLDIGGVD